jgi:putative glutamine amidotransferase
MLIDHRYPVVGVPACVKQLDGLPFHAVGEKYLSGVLNGAAAMPVVLPAFGPAYDTAALFERLDGLLFTGSPSNVAAHLYDGPPDRPESPRDPQRDETTLPLIRAAIAAGMPILCICRGLQELNVALGGTLHQQVHMLAGKLDHRAPQNVGYDARYAPRHKVVLEPGGMLARLLGCGEIETNSLHWQAIDRLAPGLVVEGHADDGVIEAVRVAAARNFALGVQWHPEYRVTENAVSLAIFKAFGDACRVRAASRTRPAGKAAE